MNFKDEFESSNQILGPIGACPTPSSVACFLSTPTYLPKYCIVIVCVLSGPFPIVFSLSLVQEGSRNMVNTQAARIDRNDRAPPADRGNIEGRLTNWSPRLQFHAVRDKAQPHLPKFGIEGVSSGGVHKILSAKGSAKLSIRSQTRSKCPMAR